MGANIKPLEPREMRMPPNSEEDGQAPSLREVPEKPTLEMLASGSRVGGVPVETVWNIWRAMLKTAP